MLAKLRKADAATIDPQAALSMVPKPAALVEVEERRRALHAEIEELHAELRPLAHAITREPDPDAERRIRALQRQIDAAHVALDEARQTRLRILPDYAGAVAEQLQPATEAAATDALKAIAAFRTAMTRLSEIASVNASIASPFDTGLPQTACVAVPEISTRALDQVELFARRLLGEQVMV